MDTFLILYKHQCQRILNRLSRGTMSSDKYTSSDEPFFRRDKHKKLFEQGYDTLPEFPEGLNINIILMFRLIGGLHKEIYLDGWTIMSLDECLTRYNKYCEEGQKEVFDIAYSYMGLGHIRMISCDLSTHRLYTRHDGGSNGYDRELNHETMIKNGPNKNLQLNFSDWFY